MSIIYSEFKRKFSLSMCKNLKIRLGEMSFFNDFVNGSCGDLYPVIEKDEDCMEKVEKNRYTVENGSVKRFFCQFFPYATYEMTVKAQNGKAGFSFIFDGYEAQILVTGKTLTYICEAVEKKVDLPEYLEDEYTVMVSCRPSNFDIYFKNNDKAEYFYTFQDEKFETTNVYSKFSDSYVLMVASGTVTVKKVLTYIDNGIAIADIRPIRYENSEVMIEQGKIYFTASVRLQAGGFQGIFSWIPGTSEFDMTGALFYDSGDGKWCGDVAASVLYHRSEKQWYLWVCSFSHGHILGHSVFEGDIRFGVNVADIILMEKAAENADISVFKGFQDDEDPDFLYDENSQRWLMAICRINPQTQKYVYVFFESDHPFDGYKYIGQTLEGYETGGSFVKIDGEIFFVCGNDFNKISDYRIYSKSGMRNAVFNYPDGGFRGWGTVVPVKQGSRIRYYWLTFDRYRASDFNWSYGNLYFFESGMNNHNTASTKQSM